MISNVTKLAKSASPTSALDGFNMLINAHQEYTRIRETEQTKRHAIEAWRDIEVNKTNQQVTVFREYLQLQFAERRVMIDGFFNTLDEGIKNNNDVAIQAAMTGIVNIAQSSPLVGMENCLQALNNPNIKHIEI